MKRYVTATGKDSDGDITALCNTGMIWSPRSKANAIRDIENGTHSYWVKWSNYKETKIRVVGSGSSRYLRTDRDATKRNNLDDLPNC